MKQSLLAPLKEGEKGDVNPEKEAVSALQRKMPCILIGYWVFIVVVLGCVNMVMVEKLSSTFYLNTLFAMLIPSMAVVLELVWIAREGFSKEVDGPLASGPMMPISCFWYLYSNYLCAQASIKYCTYVPRPVLVLGWIGLMGGGIDHVVETWQWCKGISCKRHKETHRRFGSMWLDCLPWGLLGPVFFVITSIVGIFSVVGEVFLRETYSVGFAALLAAIMLPAVIYEAALSENPHVHEASTVTWHLGHMFITHVGLSMMPAFLVWMFRPDIDLFTLGT